MVSKCAGLSLIELLISIALIGLLSMFCLPIGVSIYQKNQLEVRKNELITALHYARNMAILYGMPLVLTPLPDSADWSQGMLLFIDNNTHQYGAGDELLQQWHWSRKDVQVSWHGFHSDRYLIFSAELKHLASSGHFIIQNAQSPSIKLVVNRFGRIRSCEA